MAAVKIVHFSDLLCIWGYIGEANLARLAEAFGEKVELEIHFCSVFPDTHTKISSNWRGRGDFAGYAGHVREVAAKFDWVGVHEDVWAKVRPRSSASPHLLVKAIAILEEDRDPKASAPMFADRPSVRAAKELRSAFFREALDVANWNIQRLICQRIGVSFDDALKKIETGEAIARLAADYELAQSLNVQGSPTYILNEGRQKLFGNISFGILSANVNELLASARDENASSCR